MRKRHEMLAPHEEHNDKGLIYWTWDATRPYEGAAVSSLFEHNVPDTTIIAHVCNDLGLMGAGFAKTLATRYPEVLSSYRNWAKARGAPIAGVIVSSPSFGLGHVQMVPIVDSLFPAPEDTKLWVANMIAQSGIANPLNPHPLSYHMLNDCLLRLRTFAGAQVNEQGKALQVRIQMPRIGAGLARGNWTAIERRIRSILVGRQNIEVVICTPPKGGI